ncbi:MAG: hypothetical protein CVU03_05000 [Bacteroidetes bacterium HGW-Bacteroidetes-2]|jgi:hypothetical protein|nr:MAG: hypothetical protein CVU03_05000 [Bacteroidetes bacterium HGW-Bacteroidetes-2]
MILELWLVVSAALGAFLTKLVEWIFNKKSQKEDTRAKVIQNEISLADAYKKQLDDLEVRYEKKFVEIVTMYDRKVRVLEDEITLLNRKVKMLKSDNTELRKRIKENES